MKLYKCYQSLEIVISQFVWQCCKKNMSHILYVSDIYYWSKILWTKQNFIAHTFNRCSMTPVWLLDQLENTESRNIICIHDPIKYQGYCFIDSDKFKPDFVQQQDETWKAA